MGVRFQTVPGAEPSQIILHVTTHDVETSRERETIGLIGVNLLYGAVYQHSEPEALVASLLDNLTRERVEIDMIKFSGPAFAKVDNCLMSLQARGARVYRLGHVHRRGRSRAAGRGALSAADPHRAGPFPSRQFVHLGPVGKGLEQFRAEPESAGETPSRWWR